MLLEFPKIGIQLHTTKDFLTRITSSSSWTLALSMNGVHRAISGASNSVVIPTATGIPPCTMDFWPSSHMDVPFEAVVSVTNMAQLPAGRDAEWPADQTILNPGSIEYLTVPTVPHGHAGARRINRRPKRLEAK